MPALLSLTFPVTIVVTKHQLLHLHKISWLAFSRDVVFESFREAIVIVESECRVTPRQAHGVVIKLEVVCKDLLVVLHLELCNVLHCVAYRIVWAKASLQLSLED